ncbi:HipA N-terminal domain-containing protein [Colwellia sp. BRX10-4]|jgi:serine/threonine-protein kinase HipA|uniref:HipA N-terminal domain-containing protein n=1 Tax=Colwellia sp. BRX10-4 TaxID=2759843 RepID=UPI0015F4A1FE|nr:HipA N-terminal domain-containing protein [Colwellia sp. BRX10-4]MBA6398128.1 HipA N-terminal domain-containing protein [Colwellia sp. BRX10-4]
MKKLKREAKIFVNGKLAGILSEFREGKNQRVVFQYEEDYLKGGSPIGSSFPLTSALFEWDKLPPFFENLASEGWLRKMQSEREGIENEDTLGLLLANGAELIGALSIISYER